MSGSHMTTTVDGDGTHLGKSGEKLGLWGATPVVQQAVAGTTTGFVAGGGTTSTSFSTHTGGSGSAAYTVSDIVLALKNLGILAAS